MKRSRVAAVVGLSLLTGSGWLLIEAYPSEIGFPFAGCIHFAVIGLVGAIGARWKGWNWRQTPSLAAAGLGVFVLPGVVSALTAGAVSGQTSVAMYCAVPLLMVLGRSWFGDGSGRGLFMPSLLGLAGALLVFSIEVPQSLRRALALGAVIGCCAVVAAASAWIFRPMQGVKVALAVATVGISGAVVMGGYGSAVGWPRMSFALFADEALRCVVFDLPVVWMTVWLMREVSPVRLAARFLMAPVVTWVEGYATIRGAVEFRSVVALVLMATGAGMLLLKDETDEARGLGLR